MDSRNSVQIGTRRIWKTKPKMERHDVNKKGYNAIHCQSAFAFHIFAESQSPTLLFSIMMDQGEKNHYGFVPGFLLGVLLSDFRTPGKNL